MTPLTICIPTFARSRLLQQAFASVHEAAKRYPGPAEILVYNDLSCQNIEADPGCTIGVRVVNSLVRHKTVGDKRQMMLEMIRHTGWVTWVDDDDVVMPWHFDRLVYAKTPFITWARWYMVKLSANETVQSMEHAEARGGIVFAAERATYDRAGGFHSLDYGEDNDIRARLKGFGASSIPNPSYVYMFRQTRRLSRLSAKETAEQRATAELEMIKKEPQKVVLRPDPEPIPAVQALLKAFQPGS